MLRKSLVLMLTTGIALLGGVPSMAYEEPAFTVLESFDGVEYRQYDAYLVAETQIADAQDRDQAANIGFRRLFKYISGENAAQTDINMTAPVKQQPTSSKIDMTAPVRQTPGATGWSVAFIVPAEFDESTVPQPTDPNVYIRRVAGELMAVLRFSGRWTNKNINTHKAELLEILSASNVTPIGEVTNAFYNAPFSLPFMRRNEVMVAVESLPRGNQPTD